MVVAAGLHDIALKKALLVHTHGDAIQRQLAAFHSRVLDRLVDLRGVIVRGRDDRHRPRPPLVPEESVDQHRAGGVEIPDDADMPAFLQLRSDPQGVVHGLWGS